MAEQQASELATILRDYVPMDEYSTTLDALNQAIEERDAARGDNEKHTGRIKELEGKVRSRAYRDAYESVRKDLKIKDEFADDLFRLADFQQDADEPDPKAIKAGLEAFLKDRKHYLADDKPARLPAGEGASRGASGRPGEPEFRVTHKQLGDAGWMRENQGRMLEAKRAGLFVIEDET